MANITESIIGHDPSEDFNAFIAYFRAIDISDYLGGDRKADPMKKG